MSSDICLDHLRLMLQATVSPKSLNGDWPHELTLLLAVACKLSPNHRLVDQHYSTELTVGSSWHTCECDSREDSTFGRIASQQILLIFNYRPRLDRSACSSSSSTYCCCASPKEGSVGSRGCPLMFEMLAVQRGSLLHSTHVRPTQEKRAELRGK